MPSPEEQADALMRKIGSIPEQKIRTAVLSRAIRKLDDIAAVEVIRVIMERGGRRDPRYQYGLQALNDLPEMLRHIGPRKMAGIYQTSRRMGCEDVTRILRKIPPQKHAENTAEDIYIDKEMQEISLGMRKTMGRVGNRDLVNRLLHDQDPAVIEQVLNNPGLTEEQVLRIAAKRPTSEMTLRSISQNAKWSRRYRIRRALALNPYTPTEISVRLVGMLLQQDLVQISKDGALHNEVRKAASHILKQKN